MNPKPQVFQSGRWWYIRHRATRTTILGGLAERPTQEYLASPEFLALQSRVLTGEVRQAPTTAKPSGPKPKFSVAYAAGFYLASAKFASLSWFTQRQRRPVLEKFREQYGDESIFVFTREVVVKVIAEEPLASMQRKLRSALSDMCSVLCDETTPKEIRLAMNPVIGIKIKKLAQSEGWPAWSDEDCASFEKRWPLGTHQRLAYEIMRWTGLRIRDAVRLGPEHVKQQRAVNGKMVTMVSLVPIKTRKQPLSRMFAQMTPQLRRAIDAMPIVGLTTFIVNRGQNQTKSWPANGQPSNWFKEACVEARICPAKGRGCAAHGLRKYRLVELLHQGWNYEQIMRLSGHTSRVTLEKYLRGADRERMAIEQAAAEWMSA
jgi:Phage integrase family.